MQRLSRGDDRLIAALDAGLRVISGSMRGLGRPNPADRGLSRARPAAIPHRPDKAPEASALSQNEQAESGRLMRINHAGEVAAQGLYQGQSLASKSPALARQLQQTAAEEADHLSWCAQRLDELDAQPSKLSAVWFAGAFSIGAVAGMLGDRVNLGFLAETERQVVAHLDDQLRRLPAADQRSRAILAAMRDEEAEHSERAVRGGGDRLPLVARGAMRLSSRIMVRTSYWL